MHSRVAQFDPVSWVNRADQLDMKVSVRLHPAMPGCWMLCIGAAGRRRCDGNALLEELRPAAREQSERNEQMLAEYLIEAGRYEEAEPDVLASVENQGGVAPTSANDVHSDGMPLGGLLGGTTVLVVAWVMCLVLL